MTASSTNQLSVPEGCRLFEMMNVGVSTIETNEGERPFVSKPFDSRESLDQRAEVFISTCAHCLTCRVKAQQGPEYHLPGSPVYTARNIGVVVLDVYSEALEEI